MADRTTLVRVVVEMDYEDLEQVDIVVEVHLKWLKVEAHFALLGIAVVEVEAVK